MAGAISLDDAKNYLRVDGNDDDGLIGKLIDAAAVHIENTYGVVSVVRSEEFTFDNFDRPIRIPFVPVVAATVAMTYLDPDGQPQSLSNARAIKRDGWTWLHPAVGERWPATACGGGAVTLAVDVGFAADAYPADLQQATRMIVDHWYTTRDFSDPAGMVDFLVDHYRFRRV